MLFLINFLSTHLFYQKMCTLFKKKVQFCKKGATKAKCYVDKPETIGALKENIHENIGQIPLHTIDNVLKNWTECVDYCMASRGSDLNEIIFHY